MKMTEIPHNLDQGEDFSWQCVCVWVFTHQSRNPSTNYQVSIIMLHQVSKTEKKKKEEVQGHGFKGLECELFLKSIQAAMWSRLFAQ